MYATISKDYLSNGNQNKVKRWKNQIKSKDELIRGSSFFFSFSCSLEFKVSLLNKIGSSNLWCLVLKLTFSLLSLKSWGQVLPWPKRYPQYLSGLSLALPTRFFPTAFLERTVLYFWFLSVGTVTNPAILLVINAVQIFLSLPTGTVSLARAADYIPNFVAILHNYISFCRLGNIFRQIISKKIKPINNLLILNFSP